MPVKFVSENFKQSFIFLSNYKENHKSFDFFSKKLCLSYIQVSSLYFYLKSRRFFSKDEIKLINKPSKNLLKLDIWHRKTFFLFAFFPRSSFLDQFLNRLEDAMSPLLDTQDLFFWGKAQKEMDLLNKELQSISSDSSYLDDLIPNEDLDFDTLIKNKINEKYPKYLQFLNFYCRLLKIRCLLIQRLKRLNYKSSWGLKFLLKLDQSLIFYQSYLYSLASVFLARSSPYISENMPIYIKKFLKDREQLREEIFESDKEQLLNQFVEYYSKKLQKLQNRKDF